MIHAAHGVYSKYKQATHALYHAHHLYELCEFAELHRHARTEKMIVLLSGMKKAAEQATGLLNEAEAKRWKQIYDQVLVNAQ
ncbi:Mobile element protein [Geobacillus stearothermophilus]|uniref:Mobile element protein n=1 Tax=Geobacillus stearothermophilus TaxID=1422 RepID=A0ABQ7HJJ7_GEOSE|nr:Mobile element protein [Geobacillus stearothermophilus]